jgi:hypothetical protein
MRRLVSGPPAMMKAPGPRNDEMTVNRTVGPSEAVHGVNDADLYSTANYTIPRRVVSYLAHPQ